MATITVQSDPQYSVTVESNLDQNVNTVVESDSIDASVLVDNTVTNVGIVQDVFIFRDDLIGYPMDWVEGDLPVSRVSGFEDAVNDLIDEDEVSVEGIGHVYVEAAGKVYTVSVSGLQPSGDYSLDGHSHIASEIDDFNVSVSGLIPEVSGAGDITVDFIDNVYVVGVSGGGGGLTEEQVDDRVAALLVEGDRITLDYDDLANTLTVSSYFNDILFDLDGSTTYVGSAYPGSATSSSVWTIRKTVYNNDGSVLSMGTATNVKWDDRLTEIYS